MSKFIIENRSSLSDFEAMCYVVESVEKGKISTGTYGRQYCHLIAFRDYEIFVSADKRKSGTHKFIVFDKEK